MAIHIRRREFIVTLGGATAAWPLAVRAQQIAGTRRIGTLLPFSENDRAGQSWLTVFREGLHALGWVEGRPAEVPRAHAICSR
jgi:putative tryptophan/tyrosine transport system substrate-binding protein